MTKTLFCGLTVASLLTILGPGAFGSTIKLDSVSGYQSGSGGEFTATPTNPSDPVLLQALAGYDSKAKVNGGFETFCIEFNEHFTPGNTYTYAISAGAIAGGVSGGNPDPISIGTAWLYNKFATGSLALYYYDAAHNGGGTFASRVDAAGSLQNAIWWLEGEITLTSAEQTANKFLNLLTTPSGLNIPLSSAVANNNGTYGVFALNLTDTQGNPAQDQLVRVPDGGATVALLGFALAGVEFVRRKSKRA